MRRTQDILIDYVTTMMHNALDESSKHGKLATEDLIYLVRKVGKQAEPRTRAC